VSANALENLQGVLCFVRTISPAMQAHLESNTTSLAFCYRIERTDGQVFGFTSWGLDLTVDSEVYEANTISKPTTIKSSAGTGVDNLELEGGIKSDLITDSDLIEGEFDDALIEIFLVNGLDLSMGKIVMFSGFVGEVRQNEFSFFAEARSLIQRATQEVGSICMSTCRADFGDDKCGFDLESLSVTGFPVRVEGTVDTVTSFLVFKSDDLIGSPDGFFASGKVRFLTGNNAGRRMEVKSSLAANGSIALQLPMPSPILVGDTFEIIAGCDKRIETCQSKFGNPINFRGEPHMPGPNAILKVIR
jgi:uncharacterized phage protein (TIGR02218 family)